jgi:FtsZ-binding cell division protein ZapB
MNELKRISTNTYDDDKACINRIIRGIGLLNTEIRQLKIDKERLEKELAAARHALAQATS